MEGLACGGRCGKGTCAAQQRKKSEDCLFIHAGKETNFTERFRVFLCLFF